MVVVRRLGRNRQRNREHAKHRSQSHIPVIRVCDQAEKVIDTPGASEESVLRMNDTGTALFNRFCVRLSISALINEWLAV